MLEWIKDHLLILIAFTLIVVAGIAVIYFPQLQTIYSGFCVSVCSLALGQHISNGYNNYLDQQTTVINQNNLPPPTVPPNV
jgi:hypothetical protein